MPTINIHAHCPDSESVLALQEQVHLNCTFFHIDVTAGDDDDSVSGYMAAAERIHETEQELGRLVQEGKCTAGPGCLDPFCPEHGEHSHSAGATAEDIQMISSTIFHAFISLIRDHGYNAFSVGDQTKGFIAEHWEGEELSTPFDQLPRDSKVWWLIVLWAIQDWHARGIDYATALSMLRGIVADVKGLVS